MKKASFSLIGGIGAILVTVILYFVILGNVLLETICLITLLGVILAEAVTTILAYLAAGNPRKVTAAIVSAIMIPIAIILSVVYIIAFPFGYVTYISLYAVAFIIVMVITAILYSFSAKRDNANDALQNAKNNMLYMRKLIKLIKSNPAASQYEVKLNKLDEKLHYSNDAVITQQDEQITNMLVQLNSNISVPGFDVDGALTEIEKVIDARAILSSRTI
ncbi:MAG: hypothetical protein E7533_00010 [Ruminococcaceae bacterium]|nr:hypothetical protein [Oscillospiraceae bacterium]